jgi:hypothetical protein
MPQIWARNCSDEDIELSLKRRMTVDILFSSLFYSDSEFEHCTFANISRRLHSISQIPPFLPKNGIGKCDIYFFFLEIVHKKIITYQSIQF